MFSDPKTTIIGIATAFFAFVVFSPETFAAVPALVSLSKFAAAGGLAALGIASSDKSAPPPPPKDAE